jgi:AcrR family transcriptional regulator
MRDRNAANSPGRPREFDAVAVLRKIMSLFWTRGYEGVSLSQIMAATELQKASLYAAFGDKRSMYLQALRQYHADKVSEAAGALKDNATPPLERIRAFLAAPLAAAEAGDLSGCFLCNASTDQAALDADTRAQVQQGFDALANALRVPLIALRPDADQARLSAQAHLFLSLYSGFRVMVRSGADVRKLGPGIDAAVATLT